MILLTAWHRHPELHPPPLEEIRRSARLLVIDDQAFPPERLFTRDGYHISRWAQIQNVTQLTEGYFDVILLDLQGVGLKESPERQGLGILQHIKQRNPTQLVIAYSAQPWKITTRDYFALADRVLEKGDDYLRYKETVDELLLLRHSIGYFISKMNQELGDAAALVPKAVPKALSAIRIRRTDRLKVYLERFIQDRNRVQAAVAIIEIAARVLKAVSS